MKFPHCTIDLECLDTQPTAVITSIGAVCFDLEGNRAEFAVNVDIGSCFDYGLTLGADTLVWWFKQDKAAQLAMLENPVSLPDALNDLAHFIKCNRRSSFCCWTHATYDPPILHYAARNAGVDLNIHFREHRDIRTLTWLNRNNFQKIEKKADSVAHNALHDARNQADYISALLLNMQMPRPTAMDDVEAVDDNTGNIAAPLNEADVVSISRFPLKAKPN